MAKDKGNWIAGAVRHPGALRDKAKAAGLVTGDKPLSAKALGTLAKTGDATTKKQVALAKTLKKLGNKK